MKSLGNVGKTGFEVGVDGAAISKTKFDEGLVAISLIPGRGEWVFGESEAERR